MSLKSRIRRTSRKDPIPSARVGNPTLRDRARLAASWAWRHRRTLVAAALILVIVDCRLTHVFIPKTDHAFEWAMRDDEPSSWRDYAGRGGDRDKARAELRRHHDAARAALRARGAAHPDGLDPLLARLLETVDDRIELRAATLVVDAGSFAGAGAVPGAQMIDVASRLPTAGTRCDMGFSAAFAAATGNKAIVVRDRGMLEIDAAGGAPAPAAALDLTWSARGSGAVYAGGDERAFPGFTVTATVTLRAGQRALATTAATVDPGERFEYSTDQLSAAFGANESDVVVGMVQAVCRRLGEQLIATMTGVEPAVAAAREEPTSPESRCIAGGLTNRGACSAAADAALAAGGEDAQRRARFLLERGCDRNDPDACLRAADVAAGREAILFRLRGCDLGGGAAATCEATREAARAALTLDRREHIFAVHWGVWFERTPTSITWIASPLAHPPIDARLQAAIDAGRARVYDPRSLPPGIIAPSGTKAVYAVHGPEQPALRDTRRCAECGPDDHIDRFGLRGGCTCLPPPPPAPPPPPQTH